MGFAGDDFRGVTGNTFADFYRNKFPRHTRKRMSDELGISTETAKRYLGGNCPESQVLLRAIAICGRPLTIRLLRIVDPEAAQILELVADLKTARFAKLNRRTEEIAEEIETLKGRLSEVIQRG